MVYGMRSLAVLAAVCACGATTTPHRPTTGAIAGLARDHASGERIAKAELRLRADGELASSRLVISDASGQYEFPRLRPGRYSLTALFAGQPIDVEHIDVHAGDTTIVDVTFTLGLPDPVRIEFNDARAGAIDRYRPQQLAATASIIEGTVSDLGTRGAVIGAVVTATGPGDGPVASTLQTVSDDRGRYRFDAVTPGTYIVSAYYSIDGRGQLEVRRSDIHVAGAEAVIVPLWVEIAKQ